MTPPHWPRRLNPLALAMDEEHGHTAVEAAVAAALLAAVLLPLTAFAGYVALERRAAAYAEALALGERRVETFEAGTPQDEEHGQGDALSQGPVTERVGRFRIEQETRHEPGLVHLRVEVYHRGPVPLVSLETSAPLP